MRLRTSMGLLAIPTLLLAAGPAAAGDAATVPEREVVRWEIDVAHSELGFRVRHLVSWTPGHFREWSGTILADPADLASGSVQVEIRAASIDTNHERRDRHLRSDDFFDADQHPTITFRSTRVDAVGERLRIHGELTIRGTTRPVVLEGEATGVRGPVGQRRIGFEAETRINRHDFGVRWNRAAEGGGLVLGDEVRIRMSVSAREVPST
jgi:polyisoprenoid-binding protein YceI